jgi:hypothetical protein
VYFFLLFLVSIRHEWFELNGADWNCQRVIELVPAGCAVVICAATGKVELRLQTGIAGQQTAIFEGLFIVLGQVVWDVLTK